jgi:hypothetical protein
MMYLLSFSILLEFRAIIYAPDEPKLTRRDRQRVADQGKTG